MSAGFSPLYDGIYDRTGNRFRQIITTYSSEFENGKDCTREILEAVDFKLRDSKELPSYKNYEKAVQTLLDFIVTHYIDPSSAVERSLRQLGFKVDSATFSLS